MPYKHGAYGQIIPAQDTLPPSGVATLPVYIGTALEGDTGVPILVNSFDEAKEAVGYSDNWATFTLCEAIYAHFRNSIQPMGPIVLINVYDPDVHLPGKEEGVAVSGTDIIEGLAALDLIYEKTGMVPTILAAPGWSHIPTVYAALISKCQAKINGKWNAVCAVDIDSTSTGAKTKADAITWKDINEYSSDFAKVCWPKGKFGDLTFWLSTLTVVRMQQTDYLNDNTPYVSPSNKPVMVSGLVCEDGTVVSIDEKNGNDLNAKGITTAIYGGGRWRLWGPHMGNYDATADVDIDKVFDAGSRMMHYLNNTFLVRYMAEVDNPMSRREIDTILNDAQVWLNALVSEGKLLFAEIQFNETSNPLGDIIQGDFVFDVRHTLTPIGKSLTFKIQYTTQGLSTLFGGDQ